MCKNGVSVVTEKPMATRWRDGVQMVRTCDENGVRLFVVKQTRMNPVIQLLNKPFQKEDLGRFTLSKQMFFGLDLNLTMIMALAGENIEFDGGALMNQASHYVDLLDWLIGPVEKVQSLMSTFEILK